MTDQNSPVAATKNMQMFSPNQMLPMGDLTEQSLKYVLNRRRKTKETSVAVLWSKPG